MLTAAVKLKALEDQNRDCQRHITVLKESLENKEEHYNSLLADAEELKRNLDDRNKTLERKSYQQRFGATSNQIGSGVNQQQDIELQLMIELRDKKINDLQRKLVQLENVLADREVQLDRARARLESGSARSIGGINLVSEDINHLEETLRDKEKQVSILRDQRDRAEHELNQERDSHERTIKEYKMKLNSSKFEMEKLQVS